MRKSSYSIVVIGATGLVGAEIIKTLEARQFPVGDLRLYASMRSAGDLVRCGALDVRVDLLERARCEGADLVFLAAGEAVSAAWAPRATEAGAVAIDLSQLFGDDPEVPVVVPEVNAGELAGAVERQLVTSPDAPAIALSAVLHPLAYAGIVRVVVTSLEPVSGAGRVGIEELQRQTIDLMSGRSATAELFGRRIAFNLLPQIGEFLAGGSTSGERQTTVALRRLLDAPDLPVSITRVRVPLFFGSGVAVNVETHEPLSVAEARDVLRSAPGILLQDDVGKNVYPTPAETVQAEAIHVGRLRDGAAANAFDAWITLDNICKGSAVNAVQIAEVLIRDYL